MNIVTELARQKTKGMMGDAGRTPNLTRKERSHMEAVSERLDHTRGRSTRARLRLRRIGLMAAVVAVTAVVATCVIAQTLIQPNGSTKQSPPPGQKSHTTTHEQSCSAFGAGFVKMPGTEACVKIGGWVRMEGSSR